MTHSWENPSFITDTPDDPSAARPDTATIFDAYPADGGEQVSDPKALVAEVLALTRARLVVKEERAHQELLAAEAEVYKTIGALVDLLAELDYPGAQIVQGIREGAAIGKSQKSDLEDVPLWLLDISDKWGLGLKSWGFGVDKQLYLLWVNGQNKEKKTYNFAYYAPYDLKQYADILEVGASLDRFELPTESEDLLQ